MRSQAVQHHHAPDPAQGFWLNQVLPRAGDDERWAAQAISEGVCRNYLLIYQSPKRWRENIIYSCPADNLFLTLNRLSERTM